MTRQSPLNEAHLELGARMVDFGGWEMPLSYPSGTITEHKLCRTDAVVFDVSHLGTVRLEGSGVFDQLQKTFTNDLAKIEPGRAQYTHLLNDDGSVVDDIIVWWRAEELFDVMPNASNTNNVTEAIGGTDVTSTRAILAIQGPKARDKFEKVSSTAANIPRFGVGEFKFEGETCVVAGTGYTGEDGIECAVPIGVAEAMWDAIIKNDISPAGLGARDTLRLEAGLPLHGHELGEGITPFQANLRWVVAMDKPDFVGKEALQKEKASGVARKLFGIVSESKQPLREACDVLFAEKVIGQTTSGNFSPMLDRGIALAFLPPTTMLGEELVVRVRDRDNKVTVTELPFYKLTK